MRRAGPEKGTWLRPWAIAALAAATVFLGVACGGSDSPRASAPPAVVSVAEPVPQAVPPLVSLPADDAPHADATTEWWYYNGHLRAEDGTRYGFHYVVFQVRMGELIANLAHVAVTDSQEHVYATGQRSAFARATPTEQPGFAFDLSGWRMEGYDGSDRLAAGAQGYAFNLELSAVKPPVLHTGAGVVGFGAGTNSYYYSRTRMQAQGTLGVAGRELPVEGTAWFDHQWGVFTTQVLGWDWFALQLHDGSDVMLTRVRGGDGSPLGAYGTWVGADGVARFLTAQEFEVSPGGAWRSEASGAAYPVEWSVRIPGYGVDVAITPVVEASEFDATPTTRNRYWEGEVGVTGSHGGEGFVELVGYAPPATGR
ncbi:MAG: hypothetical protein EXR48_05010 [Dehalococcoidia bacterium]|nr:hypothetical protein [Dehalococcoidia bacterium]